ncbi:MAG TPA: anti-sigma factor [Acetobacteraceae bacterium]
MSGIGGQGDIDGQGDDPDLDMAEYVLGTLRPNQARAVEALALADPAVAAGLGAWETTLGHLAALVPPVAPPSELWRRLVLATGIEVPQILGRSDGSAGRARARLRLWRRLAGAAALAAMVFAALLLRPPPSAAPDLLAALSPAGTPGAAFLVRVDADGNVVIVAPAPLLAASGQVLELWALAPGAGVPLSLGVLPGAGTVRLRAAVRPGTQLLLSQEPVGGSPTGQPTGPVVYSGIIVAGG